MTFKHTAGLTVHGRCPCKKNRYHIVRNRRTGKPQTAKDDHTNEWEEAATMQLQLLWGGAATITTTCRVSLIVCYSGPCPDDINVAETVYDALQYAHVVENDRLLELAGDPSVERKKVPRGSECVLIRLRW